MFTFVSVLTRKQKMQLFILYWTKNLPRVLSSPGRRKNVEETNNSI